MKPTYQQFLLSFLLISKALRLNDIKTRTAMNAKIIVFVICVEAIIQLLLLICVVVPLIKEHFEDFQNILWVR